MGFFENVFGAPQETPPADPGYERNVGTGGTSSADRLTAQRGAMNVAYDDPATGYANAKRLTIAFLHQPTGKTVSFNAFLTDYSDTFTSNWNEEEVYGRNDPIMTFRNTRRVISLGWSVPAYSIDNGMANLRNCGLLGKMQYPVYSDNEGASSISKAPLFRLKFVNLISKGSALSTIQEGGLLGTLKGFSFAPDIDAGFFDGSHIYERGMIAPKVINLSCEFTVLHEEELGWTSTGAWRGGVYFPYSQAADETADAVLQEVFDNYVPGNASDQGSEFTDEAAAEMFDEWGPD